MRLYSIGGLLLLLFLSVAIATSIGSVRISLGEVWQVFFSLFSGIQANPSDPAATIVLDIRLPRILLTGLVGAALATAGATYQGLFRNPLADPYLIGVAQGAGLGATIGFLLPFPSAFPTLGIVPVLSFAGALISAGSVYLLSRAGKAVPVTTLILAGVAIGAFLGAVTSYLLVTAGEKLPSIIFWLMGGFSLSHWSEFFIALPYVVIGSAIIYLYSQPLNVLQLDEEQAQQLGVNVERVKLILLLAATLMTAAAVAFVGAIGFIGIIIPHGVRLIWGPDHRFLLPLSSLAGAIFLILADTFARTVLGPVEVPVGVATAFCGAPFFLYLLRRQKRIIF
ncbi:MAG: iron chelate uptake ABC transporter family permease subunit [Chloroflexi bacterium]|nr:iron chelate uptake ABC transporter family permease subunit [Chloroflexota bacterium]